MNALQEYFDNGGSLEDLKVNLSIKIKEHDCLPLCILNYNQVHSPTKNPIVRCCRQTIVSTVGDVPHVMFHSFHRFFNLNQNPEETQYLFDHIEDATFQTKHDGSLVLVFWYEGDWHVCTRGTFGDGPMDNGGPRWIDAVWSLLDKQKLRDMDKEFGYVFELCTKWNQVVRVYSDDRLYLLAQFQNGPSYMERSDSELDEIARHLNVYRPETFTVRSASDALDVINEESKDTVGFEGLVGKVFSDKLKRYVRVKIKSDAYIRMHHMVGGEIHKWKNILPILIQNETEEFVTHPTFQRFRDDILEKNAKWEAVRSKIEEDWKNTYINAKTPKDLAFQIKDSPFKSLYFALYRHGDKFMRDGYLTVQFWLQYQRQLVQYLDENI